MALTNYEKDYLIKKVKAYICLGLNVETACLRLIPKGYKKKTIKRYYKTFQEQDNGD